jgi:hypothetical protein
MADGQAQQPAPQSMSDIFVTPQTAYSFPAASGAITLAWKLIGQLHEPLGTNRWVPLIMALVVGVGFYIMSDRKGAALQERTGMILATLFNTITLAAAAVGISSAVTGK